MRRAVCQRQLSLSLCACEHNVRFVASVTVCVALCVKDDNDYLNGRYNESSVDVRSLQFAGTDEVSWLYRQSSAWLPRTNLRSPDHQYTIHRSIASGNFQLDDIFLLKAIR